MKKRFEPIEGRNAEIISDVMSCPEVADLSEDVKFKVRLCVEEVEENILCYSGTAWVEVSVARENNVLTIGFRDQGVKFDPLDKEEPDINAPVEERAVGGLGIFICKQFMDEITYRYRSGTNELTMVLKLCGK